MTSSIQVNNYLVSAGDNDDIMTIIKIIISKHNYTNIVAFVRNKTKCLIKTLAPAERIIFDDHNLVLEDFQKIYTDEFYESHKNDIFIFESRKLDAYSVYINRIVPGTVNITFSQYPYNSDRLFNHIYTTEKIKKCDCETIFESRNVLKTESIKTFEDICYSAGTIPNMLNHWLIDYITELCAEDYYYIYKSSINRSNLDKEVGKVRHISKFSRKIQYIILYNRYHNVEGSVDNETHEDYYEYNACDVITDDMYDYDQMIADYDQMIADY